VREISSCERKTHGDIMHEASSLSYDLTSQFHCKNHLKDTF
jgi:hypothetical protein